MKLPKSLTTVTPFSKYLALSMLVIFPVISFYLGKVYERATSLPLEPTPLWESIASPLPQIETSDWKTYTIPSVALSFLYPPDLAVSTGIKNSTALAADAEYWVAWPDSDTIYLSLYLYRSQLSPLEWWTRNGKQKFADLEAQVEAVVSDRPDIHLTYFERPTVFLGREALDITVESDYETPHTPSVRHLRLFQHNGYIVMTSYNDQGVSADSLAISNQILQSIEFTQ